MPEGKRNETLEIYIGIVGTEAKSTKEKIVKHRRKIWSIPIAALALVLMLAGALVVTSIVQAQATGTKTVTGGGTVYHDAAALTAGDSGTSLATISIPEGDAPAVPDATPPTPAINGLNLRRRPSGGYCGRHFRLRVGGHGQGLLLSY